MKAVDLLIVGEGAATEAAHAYARRAGTAVRVLPGGVLRAGVAGWEVDGIAARAVLLAGADALEIWQAAGGAVVENPVLGRAVPRPGGLPGVEVAGAGLGVEGAAAQAKSGRFRARKLLGELAPRPGGGIRGA